MRGRPPVKNEPPSQPPLLEPTTTSNPVGNALHPQTFQPLLMSEMAPVPPAIEAPCQSREAAISPAPAFSKSQSHEIPSSPPPLPLVAESIVPETTCQNLNPDYPVLRLLASEHQTEAPLQPPLPHAENLHKPCEKDTNSLNQETGTMSCSGRDKTADTLSCETIPPANQITNDPPLKKTRTMRRTLELQGENQSPVKKSPRTKRKPQTETVPPANQITNKPALKKTRTMRELAEPRCKNQSPAQESPQTVKKPRTVKEPQTVKKPRTVKEPQTVKKPRTVKKPKTVKKPQTMDKTTDQPDTDRGPNRGIEMDASQIDTNEEISGRPATEVAPPKNDTRHSQTPAPSENRTQASVRNMIPVSVYAGGEVLFNQMGAEYSIPPMFTFAGTPQTTYKDVRSEIHRCLKLSEDQLSFNIQARYNVVLTGPFFFTLLAINDDRSWQLIYEMAVSGVNWRIIELYVKMVPNQSSQNANPDPIHSHGTSIMPQQVPKQISNSPRTSSEGQQFMPMNANPSQTKQHNAPVPGSSPRPNPVPIRSPTMRPSVPNNPILARPGINSKDLWCVPMHDSPSQIVPCNSPVVSSFQKSIPGIFNRFTKGGPSELIPFADEGSFSANQIFKSKKHLWFAITDLHIKKNIEIVVTSSSKSKLEVRCKNKSCQWELHATPTRLCSNWTIKTCLYPHTCHEASSKIILAELTVEIIARMIFLDIQQGSELKIMKLHELVLKRFPGAQASYNNLWHTRKILIEELFGNWEESYALLPRLFEAIKASNPETKFDLQSDSMTQSGNQQFNRVAWAFGPCINAYRFLRPVISVKALSLLGKYDGRLLIACGYDADNQPVPLAFALVNGDTKANWIWFMRFLRKEVIGHNQLVCVISDCDGCIKSAFEGPYSYVDKAMLQVVHRFCSQNVADCLSKVCKDIELIDKFKSAAQKTTPRKFEEARNAIKIRSPETYQYLERLGKRKPEDRYEQSTTLKWAQYEDTGYRYGIMNSNCSETVKKVLKGCRHLPVAAIVENTFSNCKRWFSQRRQNAAEQVAAGKVRPYTVTGILKKRGDKAQEYDVKMHRLAYNRKVYEVAVKPTRDHGLTVWRYNVTVEGTSTPVCECRKLKFTGIPCSHVIAACREEKVDPKRFVHSYYSLQMLVDTWSADFHLYGNQTEWPEYNGAVIVPDKTLLRTRPRKPENPKDNGKKRAQSSTVGGND